MTAFSLVPYFSYLHNQANYYSFFLAPTTTLSNLLPFFTPISFFQQVQVPFLDYPLFAFSHQAHEVPHLSNHQHHHLMILLPFSKTNVDLIIS